jgi:glycosyltransferase involved in cell wall biosynthesis
MTPFAPPDPSTFASIDVSVIIPTMNEAKNLPHVLPLIPEWVSEIIIVDGRSTDDTVEVAQQLRSDVRIVLEKRRGKGIALQTGFRSATGDIIVMLDADGSMDPAEIPSLVFALVAGADVAKGSRFLHGASTDDMEWTRRFGNWGLTMLVRSAFGGRFTDLCYGYLAFWTDLVPHFCGPHADGFEIETFMNVRALTAGLHVIEVPSYEAPRQFGESNLSAPRDGMRVLRTIVRERLGIAREAALASRTGVGAGLV